MNITSDIETACLVTDELKSSDVHSSLEKAGHFNSSSLFIQLNLQTSHGCFIQSDGSDIS